MRSFCPIAVSMLAVLTVLATDARAQDGLLFFSKLANAPAKQPIAVVVEQTKRQVELYKRLVEKADLTPAEQELARTLQDSIWSVARFCLNESNKVRGNHDLARALMPFTAESTQRGARKLNENYVTNAKLFYVYDVARAIRTCFTGFEDDGLPLPPAKPGTIVGKVYEPKVDRELACELLRNLVGATPHLADKGERQFITNFEIHDLAKIVYPELPTSGGHKFKDYIDLTKVAGDAGKWIDGLAGALTAKGRAENTGRILEKLDELEAARTAKPVTTTAGSSTTPAAATPGLIGGIPR